MWSAVTAEQNRLRQIDGNGDLSWHEVQVQAWVNVVRGECGAIDGEHADSDPDSRTASSRRIVDRVPEVTILVGLEWLLGRAAGIGICETSDGIPLPVDTVRRLCCEAEIIPAVLDGEGRCVDHGRSRRTASREQRRRLRAMHRTCAFPGCGVGFESCRIHHVAWWRFDGPSDIDNLLPLCERHHHLVHEGRWQLTMTPDRVATWRRPDGVLFHTGSTINRWPSQRHGDDDP